MNWDAISALAEVGGVAATLLTLVFLALQIRDNTAALRASVFNQKTDSWAAAMRPLLEAHNSELYLSGGAREFWEAQRSMYVAGVQERVAQLLTEAQRRE